MLKVEVCAFSGLKIYPGHGKRVTRADGKTQIFLNSKCERNHALKRNPRKVRGVVRTKFGDRMYVERGMVGGGRENASDSH